MKIFYYFVLIGAPGSGKGTQSEILSKKFNLLKISPGEILRKMVKESPQDPFSIKIESYISKGNLVPIEIINKILINYIDLHKTSYDGILFDGYPRNLEQYDFLNNIIAPNGLNATIYLEISLDQLLDRLLYRKICGSCGAIFNTRYLPSEKGNNCDKCNTLLTSRSDDANEEIVVNRFKVFHDEALPIIEKYKLSKTLITVQADQDITTISAELDDIIKKIIHV